MPENLSFHWNVLLEVQRPTASHHNAESRAICIHLLNELLHILSFILDQIFDVVKTEEETIRLLLGLLCLAFLRQHEEIILLLEVADSQVKE